MMKRRLMEAQEQCHRQRLGAGRLLQRDMVRQRNGLLLPADKRLPEAALHMRRSHGAAVEAHVQAVLGQPFQAVAAVAAGGGRADGDAVARRDAGDAGAGRGHGAGRRAAPLSETGNQGPSRRGSTSPRRGA